MTANTGSARELPAGRLTNFEDSPIAEDPPAPLLPPRRPSGTVAAPPRGPGERNAKSTQRDERTVEGRTEAAGAPAPAVPTAAEPAAKGPEDRVRPSNVHIPVSLLEPLVSRCKSDGLSHGEIIIVAIENAHPRLKDLIHPAATAGGALFASRRSRASRKADGPLTPLNYRLREADFATLDQIVEEFGASSRGHLITAALTDYFSG